MSYHFKEFAKLTEDFRINLNSYFSAKQITTISSITAERGAQIIFLKIMLDQLQSSSLEDTQKSKIFTAAMYVMHTKITKPFARSREFQDCLAATLSIDEDNIFGVQEQFECIDMMKHFVKNLTLQEPDKIAGMKPNHPFSSIKSDDIKEFISGDTGVSRKVNCNDVRELSTFTHDINKRLCSEQISFLECAIDIESAAEKAIIAANAEEEKNKCSPHKTSRGLLGLWSSGSSPSPASCSGASSSTAPAPGPG